MREEGWRFRGIPVVARFALVLVLASAAGCGEGPTTGPDPIHWDRQTCEHCQMVISDRLSAVEIQIPGERRAHAFDDLGCALLWLDEQRLAAADDSRPEVWVRDPKGSDWVDGRSRRYATGFSTPMAYGFGVVEEGEPLEAIRTRVREAERLRRGLE